MTVEKIGQMVRATPSDGSRFYNEKEGIVADSAIYLPSESALAQWREIGEDEAMTKTSDVEPPSEEPAAQGGGR